MNNFLSLSLLLLIGICCSDPEDPNRKDGFTPVLKSKEDSLYHEVINGHDAGMAKMGKLKGYKAEVQNALDSIAKFQGESKVNIAAYKTTLEGLFNDLESAEEGMNVWMEQFNPDSASGENGKRINYLESEKRKVTKVREDILNSLMKADSILKQKN